MEKSLCAYRFFSWGGRARGGDALEGRGRVDPPRFAGAVSEPWGRAGSSKLDCRGSAKGGAGSTRSYIKGLKHLAYFSSQRRVRFIHP